ncbi:DMT family transporter [Pedobacter hartonius]|uniref:Permease of the drug/metabolite transporter (DMT) superfamily n=1 Tax=Pedobacter hartonius TaxID=425514 RepID=A0A1H4HB90_9SPHI|nr:EamA family transporter [Pedobacter hartonius]SEB18955.1 Permease of the drug/metabolite transporter (DMT) superfamily [Pedobacter hartonius]
MPDTKKYKGFLLALTAAIMWGVSGTCVQFLFQHRNINTEWLVTVRLLLSGILLLCFAQSQKNISVWAIWKNRKDAISILIFSILGMLAVQYTYFAAIQFSNAATATILQYMAPVIIVIYVALRGRKAPTVIEGSAILLTLCGTFLIVTHGSFRSLSLSGTALFWGILSAFALATYTLLPIDLLKSWDSSVIVGWGMLLGGIAFSFVHAPWKVSGQFDLTTIVLLSFIILFGSLLAFCSFMVSVKIIGPTNASLLSCTEPLSSTVLAVIWLKVPFGIYDWLGTALILATIVLLAMNERMKDLPQPEQ